MQSIQIDAKTTRGLENIKNKETLKALVLLVLENDGRRNKTHQKIVVFH